MSVFADITAAAVAVVVVAVAVVVHSSHVAAVVFFRYPCATPVFVATTAAVRPLRPALSTQNTHHDIFSKRVSIMTTLIVKPVTTR